MMAQTGTITTGSHGRELATAPDFFIRRALPCSVCSVPRLKLSATVGIEMRRANDGRVRWQLQRFPDGPQSDSQ
jgi:hypothetical protein